MSELYLIEKSNLKTTPKGKTLKEVELTDGMGKAISTTAWLNEGENDEWFNSLKQGEEVEGIITKAGYFASGTPGNAPGNAPRNAPRKNTNAPRSFASVKDDVSASHQILDAMTRKEESIKKFVDKKEQGMIYFASLREAGNILITLFGLVESPGDPKNYDEYHKKFWEQQRKFYQEIVNDPQR